MKKVLSLLLSFILLMASVPVGTISAEALEYDVIEIRTIAELYNINFVVPQMSEFATAIGACIAENV